MCLVFLLFASSPNLHELSIGRVFILSPIKTKLKTPLLNAMGTSDLIASARKVHAQSSRGGQPLPTRWPLRSPLCSYSDLKYFQAVQKAIISGYACVCSTW